MIVNIITFFAALGSAFILLKLNGIADWSWWVVTLPYTGGFVITGILSFLKV